MLQDITQKLSSDDLIEQAENMQKELRRKERDEIKKLCFDLAKPDLQVFSDYHYAMQEYYSRLGVIAPIMKELEKVQEIGTKQYIRRIIFDLKYDSFLSHFTNR